MNFPAHLSDAAVPREVTVPRYGFGCDNFRSIERVRRKRGRQALRRRDQQDGPSLWARALGLRRMTEGRFIAETLNGQGVTPHVVVMDAIIRRALAEMEDLGIRRVLRQSGKGVAYIVDGYARASRCQTGDVTAAAVIDVVIDPEAPSAWSPPT